MTLAATIASAFREQAVPLRRRRSAVEADPRRWEIAKLADHVLDDLATVER